MKKSAFFLTMIVLLVGLSYVCFNHFRTSVNKEIIAEQIPDGLERFVKGEMALYNAQYEFEKTRNPLTNEIPDNIKANELAFASTIPKRDASGRSQFWESRGPAFVGGRMLCIAFDMEDENIILAGSASGGMWRTRDAGNIWYKVTPPNVEQSATALSQDIREGKRQTWYYGTGEILSTTERNVSTNVRTIGVGNGIFKSTDNGETWQHLTSTAGGQQGKLDKVFQGVWRIVTDIIPRRTPG